MLGIRQAITPTNGDMKTFQVCHHPDDVGLQMQHITSLENRLSTIELDGEVCAAINDDPIVDNSDVILTNGNNRDISTSSPRSFRSIDENKGKCY